MIIEVMGRHAGWLAAAAGVIKNKQGDAPHIILFPEVLFDEEKFCNAVKENVNSYGYCVIVCSEGLKNDKGQFISESGLVDSFGHAQLGGVAPYLAGIVENKLKYRIHFSILDYLQRAARHYTSRVDVEVAFACGM